jgi:hypothetical protein
LGHDCFLIDAKGFGVEAAKPGRNPAGSSDRAGLRGGSLRAYPICDTTIRIVNFSEISET